MAYQTLREENDMPAFHPYGRTTTSTNQARSSCTKVAAVIVLISVLTAIGIIAVLLSTSSWMMKKDSDLLTFDMPVKSRTDIMQRVQSSVSGNYVQYYIRISSTEENWILDDFNTNLQVLKSKTDGHSICYVSDLDPAYAMKPTDVLPDFIMPYKEHNHGIYTPDESPTTDLSLLGPVARQLCRNANVYWTHPMEVEEVTDLPTNTSSTLMAGHRAKRNIKSCDTSCCWLVCCCNTRHFTWESSEHFTCKHLCDKCTPAYKQKIQKIC